MRLYDNVQLNEEVEELTQKGIHKGYSGLITKIDGDVYTVWFTNPKNKGELCWAKINKNHLVLNPNIKLGKRLLEEIKEFVSNAKEEKYTHLTECDVKEYDVIELIVEKPEYAMEGVHKGANGTVIQSYAINGKWGILFFNVGENNDRGAEINVKREDFIIVE